MHGRYSSKSNATGRTLDDDGAIDLLERRSGTMHDGMYICPVHEDRKASLHIKVKPTITLYYCHGCGAGRAEVFNALGFTPPRQEGDPSIEAVYRYCDVDGTLVFEVIRKRRKQFSKRRPDPDNPGKYIYDLQGINPLLYRLPELIKSLEEEDVTVFIVEGEKDVDTLMQLGLVATTSGGANAYWHDEFSEFLRNAHAVIVADKDPQGREAAQRIASALFDIADSVKVVEVPGRRCKDSSDWVTKHGATAAEFCKLAKTATEWEPPKPPEGTFISHKLKAILESRAYRTLQLNERGLLIAMLLEAQEQTGEDWEEGFFFAFHEGRGVSRPTFIKIIRKLCQRGFVLKSRIRSGDPTLYLLDHRWRRWGPKASEADATRKKKIAQRAREENERSRLIRFRSERDTRSKEARGITE